MKCAATTEVDPTDSSQSQWRETGTARSNPSNQCRHLFQGEIKRTPGSTDSTNRICIRGLHCKYRLVAGESPLDVQPKYFPKVTHATFSRGGWGVEMETAWLAYPGAELLDSQVLERWVSGSRFVNPWKGTMMRGGSLWLWQWGAHWSQEAFCKIPQSSGPKWHLQFPPYLTTCTTNPPITKDGDWLSLLSTATVYAPCAIQRDF